MDKDGAFTGELTDPLPLSQEHNGNIQVAMGVGWPMIDHGS
jgi:hypothetical protein